MMATTLLQVVLTAVGCLVAECPLQESLESKRPEPGLQSVSTPAATGRVLPVPVRVKQRSTTTVAGLAGAVSLSVDDITRGQVMVTLMTEAAKPLLGPISMTKGASVQFQVGEQQYSLKLADLETSLLGDDFASFIISRAGLRPLSEEEKIAHLIEAVEKLKDAVFIRNGVGYAADEAADHLRRKHEATKDTIRTAADFIERAASKSSVSGERYSIRYSDGRTLPASRFLREELAKLEASFERLQEGSPAHSPEQSESQTSDDR